MTESDKLRNGGISLRMLHLIMIILAVVIACLLVFSTYQSSTVFTRLSNETSNYIVRQKAAHDLMEASDYLTEMVQRFTLEGDTTYMNKYFDEAFVSRRREASITTMAENDTDQGLLAQLQEAMTESQSLMFREYYAMKLVVEAKEIRDYPEELRKIELKDEDAMLSPDEKMELAQSMVMGNEYYSRKEIIRNKLKTALNMLEKQMSNTRQETAAQLNREMTLVRWVIIILTVFILFTIWLSARLGTTPLLTAVKSVQEGKPVPAIGAREFRFMARAYNEMSEKTNRKDETANPEE